jgi:sugar phosphate isomerase/epimerase
MMMTRREFTATAALALGASLAQAEPAPQRNMGLLFYSYAKRAAAEKEAGFAEPQRFLAFARQRGANAVQMPLGVRPADDAQAIRKLADDQAMSLEGIVAPPKNDGADLERFKAELKTVRECGASIVRVVLLGGRRYEVFDKAEQYAAFAVQALEMLRRAAPVAAEAKVVLAIENHKDFRADEQLELLKKISSEWVGVCLDAGNNLSLLEDPLAVATALAPFTRTVHLKDIAVEDARDGFRMAETPLGKGMLDLKAIIAVVKKANPKARFQLEMITRDPLSIPCLGEKYWATLEKVQARELARTLENVRARASAQPLPMLSTMTVSEQLDREDQNTRDSFAAAAALGL